jgi:hypothetical protein
MMSEMPQIYHGLGMEVIHPLDEAQHLSPLFVSSTMVELSSEHGSTRLPYWPWCPLLLHVDLSMICGSR